MDSILSPLVMDGRVTGIKFSLASHKEVCTSSISDCPISHPSQLTNPFLGLPLESGKCESCGTAEPGACDGHFGYIELPIAVYHPSHISELRRLLSMFCLKCLRMKKGKIRHNSGSEKSSSAPCTYCLDIPQISIKEGKTEDGAIFLELKVSARSRLRDGFWNFLERYGYRYSHENCRILLPCEVLEILKRIPEETRKRLAGKGYFPQDGYIMQKLPVPPNCLSVPDVSDGISIMSSDLSVSMLKKVLKQVEIIRSSRSGAPNFESHEVETNDLQATISQYLQVRGISKASRDINTKFGMNKESEISSTKAWLEKMKTLFISKGSGFSSRSVISGDAYKKVNEIGIPLEIAQMITFEEKVTEHNMKQLQDLVDKKLCRTYASGGATYSLWEGSKGHTSLRVGQVVHRRIMDGDMIFLNRPPSTHKHSLQALSVYVHEDHTVKINPLICGPLGADFDGDCIHLFYPQSLLAKAEVVQLFSVEQQLLSSHTGKLNLQLANDALLSLKILFKEFFLSKAAAQQLGMFVFRSLPQAAVLKGKCAAPQWTALQILQTALPDDFDCSGERYLIKKNEILKVDFNKDVLPSLFDEIISHVFFKKGAKEVLQVFNSLQPLLMENIFLEGYSVSLKDFCIAKEVTRDLQKNVQEISPLLRHLRSTYNELIEMQVENHLRSVKVPVVNFTLKASALGNLIDSKSESSINKVVQQIGFLGLQLSDRGKFYTRTLVEDMTSLFQRKNAVTGVYPSEAFGLIKSSFIQGLNPYDELVHSISSREVLVRSSRGLTEPGTLFKNTMAILRDVVICYDGTVRNVCSNSVLQFEYSGEAEKNHSCFYPAGEPVGVLAATAMSNPAYKAVLDSSPSSNSSWELMKEILLCRVNFKNDLNDRRVILYLNDCGCGKSYCKENAAYLVQNQLKRVSLKDVADEFLIEYQSLRASPESSETNAGLVGHIHLNKIKLKQLNRSMLDLLQECQETVNKFRKKKNDLGQKLKGISLCVSDCCNFQPSCDMECPQTPCLQFFWQDIKGVNLEETSLIMSNMICPMLLETIVKGDPRVLLANIIWVSTDTTTWVKSTSETQKGELALEVVLEKAVVKESGDAWRITLDSCLPVIHLIDTTRSIPYGIKQIQELFGISCAFEQAVQRLSTSIRMVQKGLLKEHLILVANSMTCSGKLIGFNPGGYRALFRSLDVQVPFTEATLFTPRKCFERAAEKFHTDSLASIVASCSWGKRVAVGTGTRFEIMWNKKEMGLDQNAAVDVYNFLQLVTSPKEGEIYSACLGEEVDDIELENGDVELNLSPDNSNKPIFDDCADVTWGRDSSNIVESGGWERDSSKVVESGGWERDSSKVVASGGWERDSSKVVESGGWERDSSKVVESGGWERDSSKVVESGGWERDSSKVVESGGWGKDSSKDDESNGWGRDSSKSVESTGWGSNSSKAVESNGWGSNTSKPVESKGWGSNTSKTVESNGWGSTSSKAVESNGWGSTSSKAVESNSWEDRKRHQNNSMVSKPSTWSGWDTGTVETVGAKEPWDNRPTKASVESPSSGGWNNMELQNEQASRSEPSTRDKKEHKAGWGADKDHISESHSTEAAVRSPSFGGWESKQPQASQTKPSSTWGKHGEETDLTWGQQKDTNSMSQKEDQPICAQGWGSSNAGWGTGSVHTPENHSPEASVKSPSSGGWSSKPFQNQRSSHADASATWGGQDGEAGATTWNKKEENNQWGETKDSGGWDTNAWEKKESRPSSSIGWGTSNDGDRKFGKNRPPRSQGKQDDRSNWNSSGIFTARGQRLDLFTSEEQVILSDVEPIMQSIRRIMNYSRDNEKDGEPLPPEDQSYVLDNIFNYHTDKAVKMGSGVDFVTVNTHSSFQDSRCFYIVSTDGRREDFSYRKCLENFVKQKHPEAADSFNQKYFSRKPPRREGGGHDKEQATADRVGSPFTGPGGSHEKEHAAADQVDTSFPEAP